MNYKLIGDVVNQELELIRINEPERDLRVSKISGEKITDKFIHTFAKRNGLYKYVSHDAQYGHKKVVECDVCCQKFTNDKNMRDHRKRIHFSFLK